jgi:hypothetical protein
VIIISDLAKKNLIIGLSRGLIVEDIIVRFEKLLEECHFFALSMT